MPKVIFIATLVSLLAACAALSGNGRTSGTSAMGAASATINRATIGPQGNGP